MSKPKQVVDPTYAKSDEYKKVIATIAEQGDCPFCPENFKHHKKEILNTDGNWFITENSWPYDGTSHHLLLINTQHKEQFAELTPQDFQSVMNLVNWAIKKFELKGGGITLRFGETRLTGATVCHLHFHLIVPELDPQTNRGKTVNFPIG